MKNARKSNNSGITLIALVVTIIVLLILAGISISILSGDNSILQKGTEAKQNTVKSQIEERIKMANNVAVMNGLGELLYGNLKVELAKEFGEEGTDWSISEEKENPWVVTVDEVNVSISHIELPIDGLNALKQKIESEQEDCSIDESGNITIGLLWDYEPINEVECELKGNFDDEYGCRSAYKGNIVGGKIETGFPIFIKENGKTYKVTGIGEAAFAELGLNEINIPDTITYIGVGAFYYDNLTSIVIPNKVEKIESYAFEGNSNLSNIIFSDLTHDMGFSVFDGTNWYNNQPNGLVYAGKVAYKVKLSSPSNIEIVAGTLGIASEAFRNQHVTNIILPDSIKTIGQSAFSGCQWVNSINIPESVIKVGVHAFYDWNSNQIINIPFNQNNLPTNWDSHWDYKCNAQILYLE